MIDWRCGAHYRALHGIDRAGLAWEWLRRDPGYAADTDASGQGKWSSWDGVRIVTAAPTTVSQRWGLHFRRAA